MSARVESTPVGGSAFRPFVIAVVAALGLGALAIGTVRLTTDDGAAAVTTRAPLWDAQKLEAMEGRQLAAVVGTQPVGWDAQKLEAMEGRQLAAVVGTQPVGWDAKKLEAMEGRQLAAVVSAEDPVIAPHIPRRAPGE